MPSPRLPDVHTCTTLTAGASWLARPAGASWGLLHRERGVRVCMSNQPATCSAPLPSADERNSFRNGVQVGHTEGPPLADLRGSITHEAMGSIDDFRWHLLCATW